MNNIDIRTYIVENFKEDNEEKIRNSIETTIEFRDDDALIGLGVLFEILWNNMTEEEKKSNLEKIISTGFYFCLFFLQSLFYFQLFRM